MITRFVLSGMFVTVAAVSLAGCKEKPLSSLYCEGGVSYKGESMGGECLDFSTEVQDRDPTSVGSVHWSQKDFRYSVRRVGKNQYGLFLSGSPVGTFDRDDNWIKLKLSDDSTRTFSLRDDPPGFLN